MHKHHDQFYHDYYSAGDFIDRGALICTRFMYLVLIAPLGFFALLIALGEDFWTRGVLTPTHQLLAVGMVLAGFALRPKNRGMYISLFLHILFYGGFLLAGVPGDILLGLLAIVAVARILTARSAWYHHSIRTGEITKPQPVD
jgi:hypothetical protein